MSRVGGVMVGGRDRVGVGAEWGRRVFMHRKMLGNEGTVLNLIRGGT